MPASDDAATARSELIRVDVRDRDGAVRLDRLLAARLAGRTRSQLQRLIREGRARIGSKPGRPSSIVQAGDVVTLEIPPPRPAVPEAEAIPLTIVYEDADLIVVDKPAGMVVHPATGHARHTLVNALLHHVTDLSGIGGTLRPGIVHRLDRGTSGLIVVAKHDRSHSELARQFRSREVEKTYVVLVWGAVEAVQEIDLPIGRDPVDRKKISTRSRRPRAAVTRVLSAEQLDGATLLEVRIVTGRTHQIRVHLRAVGHPVVGDPDYGGVRRHLPPRLRAVQRLKRPFLHASRLAFSHPRDGRRLDLNCALPPDLTEIMASLRAAGRSGGAPSEPRDTEAG